MRNSKQTALVYKPLGQTPLESIEQLRMQYPQYSDTKIAYAGRLDPMAEGQLLLLLGDACKERDKYLGLDKEYEFEVLLGVDSDTHDILGLTNIKDTIQNIKDTNIQTVTKQLRGKQTLPYPAYSSKTVEGKPLFLWALEKRLDKIQIPTKDVRVFSLDYLGRSTISKSNLWDAIHSRIGQVTPVTDPSKKLGQDFRRTDVLRTWKGNLKSMGDETNFTVLKFRCVCSSGTYMRVLADMIGQELGVSGLAWSIKRTRMGRRMQWGRVGWWSSTIN